MTGGGERGEKPAGRPSVRTARVGDAEAIAAIGSIGFRAVHDDIVGEEFAAAVVDGPVDGNSWYSSALAIEAPAPPRPVAGLLMRFTKPVV